MWRLTILVFLVCAGCGPRAVLNAVDIPDDIGTRSAVYVATTRTALLGAGPDTYGRGDLGFGRFEVSIPPEHALGRVDLPGRGAPDPTKHFLIADAQVDLSQQQFASHLSRAFRDQNGRGVLYVHGFNNVAADGVNRIAQMNHDVGVGGVLMSYAWPSAGSPLGYAHDRDSALFARDGLADMITLATRNGGRNVLLVAHSMGSLLTMEALRTLALQKRRDVLNRLDGVVLIAPDIDIDVFKAQAATIGTLPQPFIIFTSGTDRALRLSARLSGQANRLGTLQDIETVSEVAVTVLDVSQFNRDSESSHFIAGSSPQLLRIMARLSDVDEAFQRDAPARIGLLPGTALTSAQCDPNHPVTRRGHWRCCGTIGV